MSEKSDKFKFIDLFAGIGGFRVAMESVGGHCAFSSEWDKNAQNTYKENFGYTPKGDITKIKEREVPNHDILCAGFPCQAFSISGKQLGFGDTRGTLFFEVARIAKYHKPKVLFLENVKNFVSHDKGKTLETVKNILESLGYKVHYKVLNASDYGCPTARQRVYIIGVHKSITKAFSFPLPTYKKIYLDDILEKEVNETYFIKREDIKILLPGVQTPALEPIKIGIISYGRQGERIYSTQGHAITLSAHGGGPAAKTGAYLTPKGIRKLTPKECARVMGFPKNFKLPNKDHQAYKQFGNSVAIPVVKAIAKQIIQLL